MKQNNWHKAVFKETLKSIARQAEKHTREGVILDGWYQWFQETHPKVHEKYLKLRQKMNTVKWGKLVGEKSMAEFKKMCKEYEVTWAWVLDQYVNRKGKAA